MSDLRFRHQYNPPLGKRPAVTTCVNCGMKRITLPNYGVEYRLNGKHVINKAPPCMKVFAKRLLEQAT